MWARNMCEVEIYAEFAPPGEWTSKLELFLGEGGFFWEVVVDFSGFEGLVTPRAIYGTWSLLTL